jgi:hypothetical protein
VDEGVWTGRSEVRRSQGSYYYSHVRETRRLRDKARADNGKIKNSSTLAVSVEMPPPTRQLEAVYTKNFKINSKFWDARVKALAVNWISHCIDVINRSDVTLGPGGIDNFVEAGKKLRGEKAGFHKGYVFSNAWVHQTVEAMSIALMIDPQGDSEIMKAPDCVHAGSHRPPGRDRRKQQVPAQGPGPST